MKTNHIYNIPFCENFLKLAAELITRESGEVDLHKNFIFIPGSLGITELKIALLNSCTQKAIWLPNILPYTETSTESLEFLLNYPSNCTGKLNEYELYLLVRDIALKKNQDDTAIDELFKLVHNIITLDLTNLPEMNESDRLLNEIVEEVKRRITTESTAKDILRLLLTSARENQQIKYFFILPFAGNALLNILESSGNIPPNFYFILRGLDYKLKSMPQPEHPQYQLQRFLSAIDADTSLVFNLSDQEDKYINLADEDRSFSTQESNNLQVFATDNIMSEARIIGSIASRYRDKKLLIATNQEHLKQNITFELQKRNIEYNSKSKRRAIYYPESEALLTLIKILDTGEFNSLQLLQLFKNPIIRSSILEKYIHLMENKILPSKAIYKNYKQLLVDLCKRGVIAEFSKDLDRISAKIATQGCNFIDILREHLKIIKSLGNIADETPVISILESLANKQAVALSTIIYDWGTYYKFLASLLKKIKLENKRLIGEGVYLYSLGDVSIDKFDVVIVPGAVEGILPCYPASAYSLQKQINMEIIGSSAWDFIALLNSDKVYITYSYSMLNQPVQKSRWIDILRTYYNADVEYIGYTQYYGLHSYAPVTRPEPYITNTLKPKRLSSTALEILMNDPYVFYAKYVLGLTDYQALIPALEARDFGILLHKILAIASDEYAFNWEQICEDIEYVYSSLIQELKDHPEATTIWKAKIKNIILALEQFHKKYCADLINSYAEIQGSMFLNIQEEQVEIHAIADRIDIHHDNHAVIYDYKTGMIPTRKEVKSGLAPQLSIESLILNERGYNINIHPDAIEAAFISVKGKTTDDLPRNQRSIDLKYAKQGLINILEEYLSRDFRFKAAKEGERYKDFTQLTRKEEWLS